MVVADTIPRYAQPMDVEPVGPFCGECAFYKEVTTRGGCVGLCLFEAFHAAPDGPYVADVYARDADDEACRDWEAS